MISKRNAIFLGFTFAWTWSIWWLLAYLTHQGLVELPTLSGQMLLILGGSGPTLGAYLAVLYAGQEDSLNEFHSRVLKFGVQPGYYAFAFLVPVALGLSGLGIISSFVDSSYMMQYSLQPLFLFMPLFLISIVMGGIEEFGWRGVLQPELAKQMNLIQTNLVIGIVWVLWRLPLFYIVGIGHEGGSFCEFCAGGRWVQRFYDLALRQNYQHFIVRPVSCIHQCSSRHGNNGCGESYKGSPLLLNFRIHGRNSAASLCTGKKHRF